MFEPGNITDKTESRRKALAVANDWLALMGLVVLGFPVTAATIRTTAGNWTLIAIATMQLVLAYFRPQPCGAPASTRRARINDQTLSTCTVFSQNQEFQEMDHETH